MRTLKYTILKDKNHIDPRTRQWAGMQFEDNATEVVFDLSALNLGNALYRIDFNSAGAGYQPSENLTAEDGKIKRRIPKYITQYGGEVQITAEITLLDTENEPVSYLSYPVLVYFTEVDRDAEGSKETTRNISEAEQSALNAAERAEKAEENAKKSEEVSVEAQEKTEAARRALEGGTVFVFVGGDANSKGNVNLVVDTQFSSVSNNPIANKVVAKALEDIEDTVEQNKGLADENYKRLVRDKEDSANKVSSVNEKSTDEQYPSAKCLHDNLKIIEESFDATNRKISELEDKKLLWDGDQYASKGSLMTANQKAPLSEKISEQANGIELVFQSFANGVAQAQDYNTFFISKEYVENNEGKGKVFICSNTFLRTVGVKYIYIYDNELVGHDGNSATGTAESGIKYTNNYFVLTKVYGV